jgi:hypothetical protein
LLGESTGRTGRMFMSYLLTIVYLESWFAVAAAFVVELVKLGRF